MQFPRVTPKENTRMQFPRVTPKEIARHEPRYCLSSHDQRREAAATNLRLSTCRPRMITGRSELSDRMRAIDKAGDGRQT